MKTEEIFGGISAIAATLASIFKKDNSSKSSNYNLPTVPVSVGVDKTLLYVGIAGISIFFIAKLVR